MIELPKWAFYFLLLCRLTLAVGIAVLGYTWLAKSHLPFWLKEVFDGVVITGLGVGSFVGVPYRYSAYVRRRQAIRELLKERELTSKINPPSA